MNMPTVAIHRDVIDATRTYLNREVDCQRYPGCNPPMETVRTIYPHLSDIELKLVEYFAALGEVPYMGQPEGDEF